MCILAASLLDTTIVNVDGWSYGRRDQLGYHIHKLLMGLRNAVSLSFCSTAIEVLYERRELLDSLPTFDNLTRLRFLGPKFNFDLESPLEILVKFPCLETIIFFQGIKLTRLQSDARMLFPYPPCFLNLKSIMICEFDYINKEMIVLVVLLSASKVIQCSNSFKKLKVDEENVVNDLKVLSKWLGNCTIIFKPTTEEDPIFIS